MHELDLTTLRLFVTVCETKNIARAAEQHHIVASAISKRIAQLESALGNVLVARSRRGVSVTGAGHILLQHARGILAGADRVARDMAAYRIGISGQVRVLATASSIAEFLPDDIASFLQVPEHRQIRVDVEETLSRNVVSGLRDGLAPLAVCWNATDFEGIQTRPYRSDHLAIVAHPSHPIAERQCCAFEDTLGFEHVGLPASTAVSIMLARAAAVVGKSISYRAVVSTFDASLRCVRANLGIAVIPCEVAEPVTPIYGLRVLPLADPWAQRSFSVCFHDEKRLSPAAKALATPSAQAGDGGATRGRRRMHLRMRVSPMSTAAVATLPITGIAEASSASRVLVGHRTAREPSTKPGRLIWACHTPFLLECARGTV